MASEEFVCSECDINISIANCNGCAYSDHKWIFRLLKLKWLNLRDRLLRRNCTTCGVPVNGFCEYKHLAMLNEMVASNKITKDGGVINTNEKYRKLKY